jgi:UDP-N-acetyl-D-glucosamine dehydrogenase
VRDVIKVVGGVTPRCADLAAELYGSSMRQVLVLSSARVAEMVKLLENTFHNVNVALVNEIAMMCSRMGIEVSEVIRGAATKPFGFIPFFPGAGLSGYSSPIDPLYREWTPKRGRMEAPLIDLADRINGDMPEFVAARAVELLNGQGKTLRGSRIHVLGVTRLKDAGDSREAPAIKVIGRLAGLGAKVTYSDPFVRALNIEGRRFESVLPMPERLRAVDLAIIGTGHSSFDYSAVVRSAPLVFDTSNATCGMQAENLVRL